MSDPSQLTSPPALDEAVEHVPEQASSTRSRRAFLGGLTGAVAAAALAPQALGAQGRTQGRVAKRPPKGQQVEPVDFQALAVAPPAQWTNPVARLVRRATMGMDDATLANAKAMGYQAWLQSQLEYTRLDNTALEAQVAALWPNLSGTPETLFQVDQNQAQTQLSAAWLMRAALSPRQLYERMVEFWSDHLNIEIGKVGYLKIIDERDVIRKHALGKFSDLIKASAKSPAMLAYLDQNVSRVGAPNQNYARELLELHTLGVDNGYTQDDVAELSRVLTGWTLQGRGNFFFNPTLHDWTQKTVMGMVIPAAPASTGAAGIQEGEKIIDMLVAHPNTARYISTKLLHWFVTPEPTAAQISAVSSVFRATGGDLKLVVRAVLNQGWIQSAPLKFKRPFHYMVSALRATKMTITNTANLNGQMTLLGQPLYFWETPDGYPDLFEYWSGNLMPRWQVASTLSALRTGTVLFDSAPYLAGTRDAAIDLINTNFFGGEMDTPLRTALLAYANGGTFNDGRVREVISLAIASETFQWY
jgi:uncharacterized protein (DUF1800 family)